MSYCRPALRRAVAAALAFAVGPALVLVPTGVAHAVAVPTQVDLTLANPASAVAFDDGRLLTDSGTVLAHAVRADTVTNAAAGQIAVAAGVATYPSTLASTPDRHTFATSAGVDVVTLASTGRVVVRRGATTLLDVPVPTGTTWSVDLSGPYARIGPRVYDIRRGATPIYTQTTATRTSALYGSKYVWSEASGAVYLRDLATGATTAIRTGNKTCTTCGLQVAINATTVAFGNPGGWLGLWDLAAHAVHAKALLLTGVERFRIGDGFLVTTSALGIDLYRFNDPLTLSSPTDYLDTVHVVDLAVDGHAFAYVLGDGSATVAQLPDAVDGQRRPVLLASNVPAAFSPNGDHVADIWTPSFVLTQPVPTWRLQVVDPSSGAVVATFASAAGAAPTASIAASWNPGARAERAYSWTLTGSAGTDGSIATSSGAAVRGTVTIRRTNHNAMRVVAPADVALATSGPRTPLSWRPAIAFPAGVVASSYDVDVRRVRISHGKRVVGAVHHVATRTTKRAGTFRGAKGASYQFRSRNRDSLGLVGPWSAWTTSNTPLDDRSGALHYSVGWKSSRAAGRWSGTQHVASSAKRSVRLTNSATSGFALVLRTCATCGSIKVYVDDVYRGTVSLHRSSGLRRQVYSISFRRLGKHSIKLTTVTGGRHKQVALDAVVVRH